MRAFVLIRCPVPSSGGMVPMLRGMKGIVDAWAVYGEVDVIAQVEVSDNKELDDLIMQKVQKIQNVTSTTTHIVIDSI